MGDDDKAEDSDSDSGSESDDDDFLREAARAPPLPISDLIGKSLGRYRVIARIGEGGMGVVYRAQDEKLRRMVALKVLGEDIVHDDDRRRRFLREARLAAALSHPCIATVYDVGEEGHRVFLAMELVPGTTLRARLDQGAVSTTEVLRIARAIASGLAKAHAAGIVHRDLKPDNVMVDGDDVVKILDFGIAKLGSMPRLTSGEQPTLDAATATEEGRVLGTPAYMSPEQAKGRDSVDARSDVFSFGVVLYELMTGRRPFRGETTLEVLIAIDRDTPESPRSVSADIPETIERVILRCLQKDPGKRYASASGLVEALAETTSSASLAATYTKRRMWPIAAIAVPAIGLMIAAAAATRTSGSPKESTVTSAPTPQRSASATPTPSTALSVAVTTTTTTTTPMTTPTSTPSASASTAPILLLTGTKEARSAGAAAAAAAASRALVAPTATITSSSATSASTSSPPPPPKAGFVYDAPF